MDWHVRKREYSRTFKDGAGNVWGYMTAKELAKRYPNGGVRFFWGFKEKGKPSRGIFLTRGGKENPFVTF